MVDGLIGLTGITVPWIVVVAIKPAQEHALIQSQALMALIVLEKKPCGPDFLCPRLWESLL